MHRYEFKVTMTGDGDDAVEAWNDAVVNFTLQTGPKIDPCVDNIEVIENNIDDSEKTS